MYQTMRVIMMAGMGLLAGLTISAGPAQASGSTTQPQAQAGGGHFHGRYEVVGYFRSLPACAFAGRVGAIHDRFADYDCDLVRIGLRRGAWALKVERDLGWAGHGHGHGHGQFKGVKGVKDDNGVKGDKNDGYGNKGNVKGDKNDGYGNKGDVKDVKNDGYGNKNAAADDDDKDVKGAKGY